MSTRVYLGGLSHRAKERDVEKFFRKFGRIREISMKVIWLKIKSFTLLRLLHFCFMRLNLIYVVAFCDVVISIVGALFS